MKSEARADPVIIRDRHEPLQYAILFDAYYIFDLSHKTASNLLDVPSIIGGSTGWKPLDYWTLTKNSLLGEPAFVFGLSTLKGVYFWL